MNLPPPRRQDLQPDRQPDPLQNRNEHCEHQNMAPSARQPQKTTENLPGNHHGNPRAHIRRHPTNKPYCTESLNNSKKSLNN